MHRAYYVKLSGATVFNMTQLVIINPHPVVQGTQDPVVKKIITLLHAWKVIDKSPFLELHKMFEHNDALCHDVK